MQCVTIVLLGLVCMGSCLPLEEVSSVSDVEQKEAPSHSIQKRFVNPMFALGGSSDGGFRKMRTKRGTEEECEKLNLCKLHARSRQNFFAAFELYFVNKENARLWDHHARSIADCVNRYGDCYDK
ncbi:uncharacterized protein LOC142985163 [Anticarsia gemmatalis]|uniref:uncharacterized protein LOC142985163 n=1 Tax=Anticarsia gemmatalis TaxID=129554 RepID=UPI003F76CB85